MAATFTRKHYVEIARILSGVRDAHEKQRLAEEFARMFRGDNPQFDAERFSSAVFGEGGRVREVVEESRAMATARATLAAHGYSIQKTDFGDYRVFPKGSRRPDEGYFTDDLDDAVATGIQMATDGGDHLVHAAHRAARPVVREADAGFAIGFFGQDIIESNAEDSFREATPEEKRTMLASGFVDQQGGITPKGWEQLNADIGRAERNALAWMRHVFVGVRDEGHDKHDDLVGTFWFDPSNPNQAQLVELAADTGRQERIDMVDLSYGDLASTAFNGLSDFGASVLGGSVTFFDVKAEYMEAIEQTLSKRGRR